MQLELAELPGVYAVCRLPAGAPATAPSAGSGLYSVTWTSQETSVVCLESRAPAGARCERDWIALRVKGPLDFSLVGVLSSLTAALASGGISVFALSTFDTDYLLVRRPDRERAMRALGTAGHTVRPEHEER